MEVRVLLGIPEEGCRSGLTEWSRKPCLDNGTRGFESHPFRMDYGWYQKLVKPGWAPPSWVFAPVWSVLYVLIFVSFGYVFYLALKGKLGGFTALPFVLNLIFNFLFTFFQFGLRSNFLAAVDVFFVLVTLLWAMFVVWRRVRWVALINIPYLIWVSFATVLQTTITYLNF